MLLNYPVAGVMKKKLFVPKIFLQYLMNKLINKKYFVPKTIRDWYSKQD